LLIAIRPVSQGFVQGADGLVFIPVRDLNGIFVFQGSDCPLGKPIDKYLFEKVSRLVDSCEGLEDFGSFDQDPDEQCMQQWLVHELIEDNKHIEILQAIVPNEYVGDILELLMNCISQGGGFRPTIFVDSDISGLYSAAQDIENEFYDMEFKVEIFAASLAAEKGYNLESICYAWEQSGWDDEIEALRAFATC